MRSIGEYFEDYVNECQFVRRLRPETIRTSREAFNHFKRTMPEIYSLADLSPEVITVFFKRLQTRVRVVGKEKKCVGIKDSSVLSYANRLKTFFKWLVERNHLMSNPFSNLPLPHPSFVDHRALTGEQIKKIMGGAAQGATTSFLLKRDLAMIGVLTFCGLRKNEFISLEVRDIDLFEGFITVRPETSKSKKLRRIPINIHLKGFLREYLGERKRRNCKTPFLFVSNGIDRGLTVHGLKHWIKRLSHYSGVKFHLHRFRHTFATNLAMQDVGAVKIQTLMGHADLKMTQVYLRSISTENMREDVNKLSFENLL